jgi:uncharacterized cupredoxin-like copper-binding protein
VPVEPISITLTVEPGTSGASGTFSGSTSIATDNNGRATAPSLSANGTAGSFGVLALGIASYPSVQVFTPTFALTNTASVPAILTAVSGTPQSAPAGSAFASALSAKVTDSGNNPLAGFTVSFTAPSSGASAMLSAPSAITNASGIAMVNATANVVSGSHNVKASSGALNANFALTNTAPFSPCDVNQDGVVNVADVQATINEGLGKLVPTNDLNGDGAVNVVDLQIVIDGVVTGVCLAN